MATRGNHHLGIQFNIHIYKNPQSSCKLHGCDRNSWCRLHFHRYSWLWQGWNLRRYFTFESIWILTIVTAMNIDTCGLITTKWNWSPCTFVGISLTHFKFSVVSVTSETFFTSEFKTNVDVGASSINVAVMSPLLKLGHWSCICDVLITTLIQLLWQC